MNIDTLIETAGFDECDQDAGTSGLCGTFALALQAVVPELKLGLICLADREGQPLRAGDGDPYWKHVVAIDGEHLFDVEGHVLLEHVIENFCWDNPIGKGGVLVPIDRGDLEALLNDKKSFDQACYDRWSAMLSEQLQNVRSLNIA